MKFRIFMKDTGAVDCAIEDIDENVQEEAREAIRKWFRWSDVVVPVKEP